jgi:leader peptidase (prepilin peptidase) / N-methyltransferase
MTADVMVYVVAFVAGAAIGSFLNVVIYRLPRGQSVVGGRSMCPCCKRVIAWYDNVPLLSYALLRGRCRRCGWKIPLRYPAVELLTAGGAVLAVASRGWTLAALWLFAFLAVMIAITFIDWEHQIIPDALSIGGTVLGWAGAWVCLDIKLIDSLVGSLVGAGLVLAIALAYKAARRVDGMGGGDVKLMAMIGAFLGWRMVFAVLLIAAAAGSVYGLYLMHRARGDRRTAVAFGSFLAPAACLMWFFGDRLISFYVGTFFGPR